MPSLCSIILKFCSSVQVLEIVSVALTPKTVPQVLLINNPPLDHVDDGVGYTKK